MTVTTTPHFGRDLILEAETRMPSHGKYGLRFNRSTKSKPVGFADSSEPEEELAERQSESRIRNAANDSLNSKSKRVKEEIETRLWAAMYLQYLMERIPAAEPVSIRLTDLPDLSKLSLSETTFSPSPPRQPLEQTFEHLSVEHQIQILDRRLLDACLGTEAIWAALSRLICFLTSGE